jgi:LmbE family N-acetylglucosaminyl deacetylase
MAKASDEGHRVVLVIATHGEEGEVADGFLELDERLEERRIAETNAAGAVLGVARIAFLGYRDSGMMGTEANQRPESFWRADVDAAAERLAAILAEEDADVLTVYDANGGYGHPDHIQVHRVGHRAAELAGTPRLFEATLNRDRIAEMTARAREAGMEAPGDDTAEEAMEIGVPDAQITTVVDVRDLIDRKRSGMMAHASQIPADSWFLALPPEVFLEAFGWEWYVRVRPPFDGAIPGDRDEWLLG